MRQNQRVVFHDWIDAAAWNPVCDIDSPPCLTELFPRTFWIVAREFSSFDAARGR